MTILSLLSTRTVSLVCLLVLTAINCLGAQVVTWSVPLGCNTSDGKPGVHGTGEISAVPAPQRLWDGSSRERSNPGYYLDVPQAHRSQAAPCRVLSADPRFSARTDPGLWSGRSLCRCPGTLYVPGFMMPGASLAYAGSFGACAGCARLRRLPSWSWLATRQYQTMTGHCLDRVRTVCVCVPDGRPAYAGLRAVHSDA